MPNESLSVIRYNLYHGTWDIWPTDKMLNILGPIIFVTIFNPNITFDAEMPGLKVYHWAKNGEYTEIHRLIIYERFILICLFWYDIFEFLFQIQSNNYEWVRHWSLSFNTAYKGQILKSNSKDIVIFAAWIHFKNFCAK